MDCEQEIAIEIEKRITSPLKAIRAFCKDCVGNYKDIICCGGENSCKLYDFRFGKNPHRKPKVYTDEQMEAMRNRFKKKEEI